MAKNRSPYDIDQKTESYFKYTQKSATILAKLGQENSKIPQNYHMISTKKLQITSNIRYNIEHFFQENRYILCAFWTNKPPMEVEYENTT